MRTNKSDWPKEPIKERECSRCDGTGFVPIVQPKQAGRRLFAPRCWECDGKGKVIVVTK